MSRSYPRISLLSGDSFIRCRTGSVENARWESNLFVAVNDRAAKVDAVIAYVGQRGGRLVGERSLLAQWGCDEISHLS
jgi:hypothetical protein